MEGLKAQFFKGSFLNKRLKGKSDQEKFGGALKEKLQQERGLPKAFDLISEGLEKLLSPMPLHHYIIIT